MITTSSPRFGIYVHIPFCMQRCHYCDFATFVREKVSQEEAYFAKLEEEIRLFSPLAEPRLVSSIYFGGGTPSLVNPNYLRRILETLKSSGFAPAASAEITIEVNPATLNDESLSQYLEFGVNRFSVGAQSFNDRLLKLCGRKHSAEDTRTTLRLLKDKDLNYSFDLLFALPTQTLNELKADLSEVTEYSPPHLSAYCLTVPENHPMSRGRPPDEEQVEMFDVIESHLDRLGLKLYEISNFANEGYESAHNLIYWQDAEYLGFGLSAHSYLHRGAFGLRFWNPSTMDGYFDKIIRLSRFESLSDLFLAGGEHEWLKFHERLTDFCHMHLRIAQGLSIEKAQSLFSREAIDLIEVRAQELERRGLIKESSQFIQLTKQGRLLSNEVFRSFTFVAEDFVFPKSMCR